jgi:hypothetical protein
MALSCAIALMVWRTTARVSARTCRTLARTSGQMACALPRRIRIKGSATAADSIDFQMFVEPVRRSSSRAMRQNIDDMPTRQITEGRPVVHAFLIRPNSSVPAPRSKARSAGIPAHAMARRHADSGRAGGPAYESASQSRMRLRRRYSNGNDRSCRSQRINAPVWQRLSPIWVAGWHLELLSLALTSPLHQLDAQDHLRKLNRQMVQTAGLPAITMD